MEGILDAGIYDELFITAKELYNDNIFAFYYDIPFEETVSRYQTRAKQHCFGTEDMKRWWKEKDFFKIIHEEIFSEEITLEEAADLVYNRVVSVDQKLLTVKNIGYIPFVEFAFTYERRKQWLK